MLERATGIEPVTSSLGSWHSTAELRPLSRIAVDKTYGIRPELSNRVGTRVTDLPSIQNRFLFAGEACALT